MVRLFRKNFLTKLREDDELELVVPRRHLPLFWPMMAALSFCLACLFAWGCLARVPVTVQGTGMILPLGGVREVVSLGQGVVVERRGEPGQQVRAGEFLLRVEHPELSQSYVAAQREYLLRFAQLEEQQQASQNRAARQFQELAFHRRSVRENLAQLRRIEANFTLAIEDFVSIEEETISVRNSALQELKQSYDNLRQDMEALRDKGLLTKESLVSFMDRYNSLIRSHSLSLLEVPRSKLEEQRLKRELIQLRDNIRKDMEELGHIDARQNDVTETRRIEASGFDVQMLAERQKLLKAERELWLASNILSPYEGQLLAVNRSVGQTVAAREPVALLNMTDQHRKLMLVLSPQAERGRLRFAAEGRQVEVEIGNEAPLVQQLQNAFTQLLPEAELSVAEFDGTFVLADSGSGPAVLDKIALEQAKLEDQQGIPVFAMLRTIGDDWQSREWVNVALLRPRDAKRVQQGAEARIKPDYEKSLIGSQLQARVRNTGTFVATMIEAEALVGSRELARRLMGEEGGFIAVLELERSPGGDLLWLGGDPLTQLTVGTTTKTRINVEVLSPIEIIIPFFADRFR